MPAPLSLPARRSPNTTQNPSRPTGLKPPSKIPPLFKADASHQDDHSALNGLSEMNEAGTNTRGAIGLNGSVKHRPKGRKNIQQTETRWEGILTCAVPEPESKQRKTLAERGGEPYGSKIGAPPTSRSTNAATKSTIPNGSRGNTNSLSRSVSTKTGNRNHANSSGYGRSQGATAQRPKSAYGSHSTHNRSKSQHHGRPGSSMMQHDTEERSEARGGHTISISTNPEESLGKLRVQKKPPLGAAFNARSFTDPFTNPFHRSRSPAVRSISSPSTLHLHGTTTDEPASTDCDDMMNNFGALALRDSNNHTRTNRMGRGTRYVKNPDLSTSLLPRPTPDRTMPPPPLPQPKTPSRPPTPVTPFETPFLNKYTNDRCPVFDDTRVASLEAQFSAFKESIENDLSKQSNLKDTVKLLEKRSESTILRC